jgi:hypothetical protein
MMGWFSGHEPQLRMMMETYKRQDGRGFGSEKIGECEESSSFGTVKGCRRCCWPGYTGQTDAPHWSDQCRSRQTALWVSCLYRC